MEPNMEEEQYQLDIPVEMGNSADEAEEEDYIDAPVGNHILFWGGAGALILAVLVIIFLLARTPGQTADVSGLTSQLANTDSRIAQLETLTKAQTTQLENMQKRQETLVDQGARLQKKLEVLSQELTQALKSKKVAVASAKAAPAKAAKTSSATKKTSRRVHTVAKGDTLYSISKRYNVTVDEIRRINMFANGAPIFSGQKIYLDPK